MYKELVESVFLHEARETVKPNNIEELAEIIAKAYLEDGPNVDLNFIDTSGLTTLSGGNDSGRTKGLFDTLVPVALNKIGGSYREFLSNFNGDVSKWDVSKVKSFDYCFANCESFSGDLSKWKTNSAVSMSSMFSGAVKFNGNIGSWNVSKVKDMTSMFNGAKSFNQNISKWNVSNVENMSYMFGYSNFDGDISKWNVSKVKSFTRMFQYDTKFSCDLSNWNIKSASSAMDIDEMFSPDGNFPFECVKNWDFSNVGANAGIFGIRKKDQAFAKKILGKEKFKPYK